MMTTGHVIVLNCFVCDILTILGYLLMNENRMAHNNECDLLFRCLESYWPVAWDVHSEENMNTYKIRTSSLKRCVFLLPLLKR